MCLPLLHLQVLMCLSDARLVFLLLYILNIEHGTLHIIGGIYRKCLSFLEVYNKVLSSGWLEIYCLNSSGSWKSKISMLVGPYYLWRLCGRFLVSSSFWWLLANLGILWPVNASPQTLSLSSLGHLFCVSVSVSKLPSSYKDSNHIGVGAHSHPVWSHLNRIQTAKTLFPNKVILIGSVWVDMNF